MSDTPKQVDREGGKSEESSYVLVERPDDLQQINEQATLEGDGDRSSVCDDARLDESHSASNHNLALIGDFHHLHSSQGSNHRQDPASHESPSREPQPPIVHRKTTRDQEVAEWLAACHYSNLAAIERLPSKLLVDLGLGKQLVGNNPCPAATVRPIIQQCGDRVASEMLLEAGAWTGDRGSQG